MSQQDTILESVAKVLIINSQQQALVLTLGKRTWRPERSYQPDLPGGIVDLGESEQAGAIREVQEECDIILDPASLQLAYTETAHYERENKSVTKLLYLAHTDQTTPVTLSQEHSDYKWVPIDDLASIDLRPFFNTAIQYAITHKLI